MRNRPKPSHVHKYTICKIYLSIMMFICIKQHLINIWSSIHEKVMQHWGWAERKSIAYKQRVKLKKCLLFQCKICHTQYLGQQQQLRNSRHCWKAINIIPLFFILIFTGIMELFLYWSNQNSWKRNICFKQIWAYPTEKPFKNDEKCFLFCLKSFFCSQDI